MNVSEKTKKMLGAVGAVVLVIAIAAWMILNPGPEHIEDTNGADNYALQQITEADIIAHNMGTRGGLATSESYWSIGSLEISDGVEYSCKKFTGVYLLDSCTIFKGSDIHIFLGDFRIMSGNFAFYVVLDGQIIGEVKPDADGVGELLIENIEKTGTLEYIIAGESAQFRFIAPSVW